MDQTSNPIPTPNPVAAPTDSGVPGQPVASAPVAPAPAPNPAPEAPVIQPGSAASSMQPDFAQSAPVQPASVVPEAPTDASSPDIAAVPEAVNPVINPAVAGMDSNIYQSDSNEMLGATDPITMPAPPKVPDPEEEELKAPFKASAPVPGSIGSAISVPAENNGQEQLDPMVNTFSNESGGRTPSVAFNDPAAEVPANNMAATAPVKKKMDKKTLYILIAIAAIVVVALIVVLISMMK